MNKIFDIWKNYLYCKLFCLINHISLHNHLLIISDPDEEINLVALKHIGDYLKLQSIDTVTIATNKNEVLDKAKDSSCAYRIVYCTKIDNLIVGYRLGIPYINLISLYYPENNDLYKLIGVRNISVEKLVCICAYRLFKYDKGDSETV